MNLYELILILKPDLTEEKIKSLQETIISFIQQNQGVFISLQKPVKKPLFFEDRKEDQGFLSSLAFRVSPEKIEQLKNFLKEKQEILRFMIIKNKETKEIKPKRRPQESVTQKTPKQKVNLEEIEKKLEEILK
jgi:small subunit ribosomal protein S6